MNHLFLHFSAYSSLFEKGGWGGQNKSLMTHLGVIYTFDARNERHLNYAFFLF